MTNIAKRTIATAFTSTALAAALVGVASTSASAINTVPCDQSGYTKLVLHYTGDTFAFDRCFANGGEMTVNDGNIMWITQISTGNNRVQWFGDGRWQPDQPIPQWATYTWPNHTGGVQIEKIRIV